MPVERPFSVSNGHALIVPPSEMVQIYGDLRQQRNFIGPEAIGWIWSSLFLPGLRAQGFGAIGLHGRTSAYLESSRTKDHVLAFATNTLVLSTPRLLELASRQQDLEYVLVHADELQVPKRQQQIELLLSQNGNSKRAFFVENNSRLRGLDVALFQVHRLLAKGINAGLAFDLVHYFSECKGDANAKMTAAIEKLASILSEASYPVILHLPVGRNPGDSLPMNQIDPYHWQKLSEVMDCKVRLVVIENQAPITSNRFPTHLILTPRERRIHHDHFFRQFDLLRGAGVI